MIAENHTDSISLALYLHTLIVFTSTKSWIILKSKNMEKMVLIFQKICYNILGDLVQTGYFKSMRVRINITCSIITYTKLYIFKFQTILLKGTSREELSLKPVSLKAIITLATRPLIDGNFSINLLSQFLSEILSVPALIWHLEAYAPTCVPLLQSIGLLEKSLNISEDLSWYKKFSTDVPVNNCVNTSQIQ